MSCLSDLLVKSDREVRVRDWTFKISPITIAQMARLEKWVGDAFPSPVASVAGHLDQFKSDLHREVFLSYLADTFSDWPPAYGSPECSKRLFFTCKGKARFIQEALKAYHPDIAASEDACAKIQLMATSDEFAGIVEAFHDRDASDHDPKAQAEAGQAREKWIGELLLGALLQLSAVPLTASANSHSGNSPR